MGLTNYKVTYECDCGENWGDCDKRSFFILQYNRTVDIGTLFHKHHADDENSKMQDLGAFTDKGLAALVKVLTQSDPDEETNEADEKDIKEARGY
jgi:hypothetical protein